MSGRRHLFSVLYVRTMVYIICSVLAVIIPVYIMLSIYSNNSVMKYNSDTIHLINNQIDTFFHSIESTEIIFSTDYDLIIPLTLYLSLPNYDEASRSIAFENAQKKLKTMLVMQNNLEFNVVGLMRDIPIKNSKEIKNENYDPLKDSWYESIVEKPNKSHIIFKNHRDYYKSADDSISVIKAISDFQTEKPMAFVIIDITYPNFSDMLATFSLSTPIEISDPSGQLLYTNINSDIRSQQYNIIKDKSSYTGITVTSYVPKHLFHDQIKVIFFFSILIIGIYLLFVFFISSIATKRFTQPIYLLMSEMKKVFKGNFDVAAKYQGNIVELNDLYDSFNILVSELKHLIKANYETNLLKTQAELDALHQKINPHFLYNTLETISSQAILDGSRASSIMCQKLGAIFSYSLHEKEIVTLESEINQIQTYLYIALNCSYYQHTLVVYDITPETYLQLIPKMTLQPLVENCFKHGFKQRSKQQPHIRIRSLIQGKEVIIEIEDNGEGMLPEQLGKMKEELEQPVKRTHADPHVNIGLRHVHERLMLYYGTTYTMDIESAEQGTRITLRMPIFLEGKEDPDV